MTYIFFFDVYILYVKINVVFLLINRVALNKIFNFPLSASYVEHVKDSYLLCWINLHFVFVN